MAASVMLRRLLCGSSSACLRILLLFSSVGMSGVSAYLTYHYYDVQYPDRYFSATICDISSYWNCDIAAFSALSNFYGIPTSVAGVMAGLLLCIGALWRRPGVGHMSLLLGSVNAVGCLGLFLYSVTVLGGLCPGCMIYYILSLVAWLCLWSGRERSDGFDGKIALLWFLIFSAGLGLAFYNSWSRDQSIEILSESLLKEFRKSPDFEGLKISSPLRLATATENFEDAPLRISLFSDFQCPVCKVLAEKILPKLVTHYRGKLNLQYFNFPMDSQCNHNLRQPMHPMACQSAWLASCLPEHFSSIHDDLYANQNNLSPVYLQKLAHHYGISSCFNTGDGRHLVEEMILAADKIGVQATPVLLINGRKFEGLLPLKYLILLSEEAMKLDQSSGKTK
ncbi:MAG: thioredoxin domain-containing protein [Deltaproteobacteria bacterium]|nr:thioredoxin domain-containing protein [Deltaproteobacteria bacterium]